MRVLVCPDKFAGTFDAADVAAAIVDGWLAVAPQDALIAQPLSDGGPGFLSVFSHAGGRVVDVATCDPLGRPVAGQVLLVGDRAYLESAQACGLHLLGPQERDPNRASSFGLGLLITAAVEAGAKEIVVGLGGSATNDAGAGMFAALGAPPLDGAGRTLPPGGASLIGCASLGALPRLRGATLVAATDVDSPLVGPLGASAVYGPQKGASATDVARLDAALTQFATVLQELPQCPPGLEIAAGGGAAGGLGAAILACGGRIESGFALVAAAIGLDNAFAECDLVITGEGSFDEQSLRGKVVGSVAAAAQNRGRPCVVIAGRIDVDPDHAAAAGVTESHALVDTLGSVARAMAEPAVGLRTIAADLAQRQHAITSRTGPLEP